VWRGGRAAEGDGAIVGEDNGLAGAGSRLESLHGLAQVSHGGPVRRRLGVAKLLVCGDDASRLIIAVDKADGPAAALRLTGAVLSAVWAGQRDIADAGVLAALLQEGGLPADRLAQSREQPALDQYAQHTQSAIDAGVFGAPSYCVDGEIFWGQDRLDFLQRRLARD